tara:strand:+ start:90 stop:320 length:231 start_codon:yes stop_codon:yes gene_type:complete
LCFKNLDAAVSFEEFVSLDTLVSSCQNSKTKLFVISGKHENVEKYHNVQLSLKTELFGLKTIDASFFLMASLRSSW